MSEHLEQVALMEWAAWASRQRPELRMLFAIPNGGARHIAVAKRMKAEGVKAGVPDLFLAVAVRPYNGLFVELKAGKNGATKEQARWLEELRDYGYCAVVCRGANAARETIERYLEGKL